MSTGLQDWCPTQLLAIWDCCLHHALRFTSAPSNNRGLHRLLGPCFKTGREWHWWAKLTAVAPCTVWGTAGPTGPPAMGGAATVGPPVPDPWPGTVTGTSADAPEGGVVATTFAVFHRSSGYTIGLRRGDLSLSHIDCRSPTVTSASGPGTQSVTSCYQETSPPGGNGAHWPALGWPKVAWNLSSHGSWRGLPPERAERARRDLTAPPTAVAVAASGTFNPLCKVLCILQSLYLCSIGPMPVLCLARDTPRASNCSPKPLYSGRQAAVPQTRGHTQASYGTVSLCCGPFQGPSWCGPGYNTPPAP